MENRISLLDELKSAFGFKLRNDLLEAGILWKDGKEFFETVFSDGNYTITIIRYDINKWDEASGIEKLEKEYTLETSDDPVYSIEDAAEAFIRDYINNKNLTLFMLTDIFRDDAMDI